MSLNETLPEELIALEILSNNMWWTWNTITWKIFRELNPEVWDKTHNPIITIKSCHPERLKQLKENRIFVQKLNDTVEYFKQYLQDTDTWFSKKYPERANDTIAYFCSEYAIHESLPIYSGGLGVLAGDHIKAASDLNVPLTFIGLFYKEGYFEQVINEKGVQEDNYHLLDTNNLPFTEVIDDSGSPLEVTVKLSNKIIYLKAWKVHVGRNTLYLLDSDCKKNSPDDKKLTYRLYGGDREMRISQEIILGIGGVKLLNELNINPSAYHMNEGHSAFFQLERIKDLVSKRNLSFHEAKTLCSSNCIFTTHTPVPAGNEVFSLPLMHKYFYDYAKSLKISWEEFIKLGIVDNGTDKHFGLTVMAIKLSRFHNGVSELHGKMAKRMWKHLWKEVPEIENPISHITNGVHVPTWTSEIFKELYAKYLGKEWEKSISNESIWKKMSEVSYEEIKDCKIKVKKDLIAFTRKLLREQLERNGETLCEIESVDKYLDPNALTIGFARRFATYKRATLIFEDPKKLSEIVNNKEMPVQFIFAGKAHPADTDGQQFIEKIYKMSRKPEFKGKIIILENYDMNISRHMVAGVDVWLNNPRRPMEASGTSGQKVPLNFGMNFSVLDGWWREGFNGKNGWKIGEERDYPSNEIQDMEDAQDFYMTLEKTIIPLYYKDRRPGNYTESRDWAERSKESLISNLSKFSSNRMVKDYVNGSYIPACIYGEYFNEKDRTNLDNYISYYNMNKENWDLISFEQVKFEGDVIEVKSNYAKYLKRPHHHLDIPVDDTLPGKVFEGSKISLDLSIYLGELNPSNIQVELVVTDAKNNNVTILPVKYSKQISQGLHNYKIEHSEKSKSPYTRFRIRLLPSLENLCSRFELGLIKWL